MSNKFSFKVEMDKLISTNEMYECGVKSGRTKAGKPYNYAYTYMPAHIKKWQCDVSSKIVDQLVKLNIDLSNLKGQKIRVFCVFSLTSRIDTRDVDNFAKPYYDAVKVALGHDDSKYFTQMHEKIFIEGVKESVTTFVEVI